MSVSAQTMLDNIETAINARLTGGAVDSYTISGRDLKYCSLKELYEIRDKLKREVNAGVAKGSTNFAQFENP